MRLREGNAVERVASGGRWRCGGSRTRVTLVAMRWNDWSRSSECAAMTVRLKVHHRAKS
jgi:hypothetical protein